MQINQQALSLFDYIGGKNQPEQTLENIAKNSKRDVAGGINLFESKLAKGEFEDTLKLMEKGELDVDLNIIENYFLFNQQKLDREVAALTQRFSFDNPVTISIDDNKLVVEGDGEQSLALQTYLDKDQRINKLVQQTSKLSQFVEWGQAKQQAAIYQSQDLPETEIVEFLKQARKVVTDTNHFVISEQGSGFASYGFTQNLVEIRAKNSA